MKKILTPFLTICLVLPLFAQRGVISIPDLKGFVTLKCDFHMHTVFSDGAVWPTVRVDEAFREGLDAISITDHVEAQPKKDDIPTAHNRAHELCEDLAQRRGVILIRGAEVAWDYIDRNHIGHHNAIFLTDADKLEPNPRDDPDHRESLGIAKAQGAFIFWNHPGYSESVWTDTQTELLEMGLMHGIEVANGGAYYPNVHRWCIEKNLTMIGNSDIHAPMAPFTDGKHRTMTLVFATERTPEAIHEALKARRTAVYWGEYVIGDEKYLKELFEAALKWRVRKTDTHATITLTNTSDLTFNLKRAAPDASMHYPRDLTVGPKSTKTFTVRFLEKGVDGGALNFIVDNFLTQPNIGMNYSKEI